MASPTKITKAVRGRKVDTRTKNRQRRVKKIVLEKVTQLKALEAAVR